MRIEKRHLVTGALLAFVAVTGVTLAVKETRHARALEATASTNDAPASAEPSSTVVVTYFHTTARCLSCLKIEELTNATMTMRFADAIAERRIVWRLVNTDEPANAHFVKDYSLYTKSVVVSEVKDGREIRWKNLDQVWQLLGNPESFQSYVEREVQAFLEKA
ncbi:MAG: nitrophenyl compound nitroreductase subunit ArsF family protein [Thermoanaerobaculia bacterium]